MPRTYPCPRCRARLVLRSAGEASLLVCVACGGAWLTHTAAGIVLAQGVGVAAGVLSDELASSACIDADTTTAELPCPACGAPLDRRTSQGVVVDTCVLHGTWFDRDELKQTVAAYRAERVRAAAPGEVTPAVAAAAGLAVAADVTTDVVAEVAAESVVGAIFGVLGDLL
jgi:Zn-finger nucleic acid-binding protein